MSSLEKSRTNLSSMLLRVTISLWPSEHSCIHLHSAVSTRARNINPSVDVVHCVLSGMFGMMQCQMKFSAMPGKNSF